MSQLEYLTVLVSIIVGLGITDMAENVRDLIHPDQGVRWHWLPLTWSFAAILMVVASWWGFFYFLQAKVWTSPIAFLLILFTALSLYLLCAFSLPDLDGQPESERPEVLDLEAFYFSRSHRRSFFGVAIAFVVSFFVIANIQRVTVEGLPVREAVIGAVTASVLFVVPYGLLILTERKWVHVIGTILGVVLALTLLFALTPALTQTV